VGCQTLQVVDGGLDPMRLDVGLTRRVAHAQAEKASNQAWNHRHVVKRGDSLWNIANRYGTPTRKIQETNGLSTTRLRINQVLRVPSVQDQANPSKGGSGTYYVRSGDSPYLIARRHNISLNHFLTINNLTSRSTIYPGQKVKTE
jgi:membrane-bound lytic murein transglycosylase D